MLARLLVWTALPAATLCLQVMQPQLVRARPLLFLLDRDGVINKDVGSPGVVRPEDFELLPGSARAIAKLNSEGHYVCVCTNQSAVGKGIMSETALRAVHAKMVDLVRAEGGCFDRIFACCETEAQAALSGSARRKPDPGMLLEAMAVVRARNAAAAAPQRCVFIGDALSDMRAAAAAGVARRVLVTSSPHGVAAAAAAAAAAADDAAGLAFEVQPTLEAAVRAVLGAEVLLTERRLQGEGQALGAL